MYANQQDANYTLGSAILLPVNLGLSNLVHMALFSEYVEIEFEGRKFMSMQLPPEEKRVSVHNFLYLNCNEHISRKELKRQKLI